MGVIGHWTFWGLLVYGIAVRELTLKRAVVFVVLWVVGRIALAVVPWEPAHAMYSSYTAILAIALVFVLLKSDIRLT